MLLLSAWFWYASQCPCYLFTVILHNLYPVLKITNLLQFIEHHKTKPQLDPKAAAMSVSEIFQISSTALLSFAQKITIDKWIQAFCSLQDWQSFRLWVFFTSTTIFFWGAKKKCGWIIEMLRKIQVEFLHLWRTNIAMRVMLFVMIPVFVTTQRINSTFTHSIISFWKGLLFLSQLLHILCMFLFFAQEHAKENRKKTQKQKPWRHPKKPYPEEISQKIRK